MQAVPKVLGRIIKKKDAHTITLPQVKDEMLGWNETKEKDENDYRREDVQKRTNLLELESQHT